MQKPVFGTPYEKMVFDQAAYFTAVRGRIISGRTRDEFSTYAEAVDSALGDGKTMIYAVTVDGLSAHLCNA